MKFTYAGLLSGILAVLLSLSTIPLSAQKEADIINKFRIALRDCALDVPEPPVTGKGTCSVDDVTFTGATYYHKPNSRMEMMFQGVTFIRVSNDTIEWEYNPFLKRHFIQQKDPVAYERELNKAKLLDIASKPLLNYKKLKNQLTYKGEQKVDSIQTYVLELTLKDPEKTKVTFYLDKRTNLIYKCESGSSIRWYANYKNVGNYVYPRCAVHSDEGNPTMTMRFDEIEIGEPIPDSLFTVPQEAFDSKREFENTINRLLDEGDSLLDNGKYDAAIAKFNEVLKMEKDNYSAYNSRGLSKIHKEKYYEGIADLNIALEINPTGSGALNNRGLAKYYVGDKKGALEDYTAALKSDSTNVSSYMSRGFLFFQASEFAKAKADFGKAIALRPADGNAHFKFGVATAQLGNYEEALTSYTKAIEFKHVTDELYNYKGVAEFKLEKYPEAAASFREAMSKNEDKLQYIDNLGNALYRMEDYKKAEAMFERYAEKDATNAETHNMIALCKYRQEDFKGAIKLFTKAIELSTDHPVYFENRGDAKDELEDYVGAISDYTQSIALNPANPGIFYKRGMIKIKTSKKLEGCLDLSTAHDMKYEDAKDAIVKYCN